MNPAESQALPPYIERSGEQVYPPPFSAMNTGLFAFAVDAARAVLQGRICDRYLNAPLGGAQRFVPALSQVFFIFNSIEALREIFMNGQTPGKVVMTIKVVRLNGTPPSIGDYLLRWIFSFVDFYVLSGAIAVIIVAAGGKGQRLGDLVAGTSVVKLIEQKEITASEVFVTPDSSYEPVYSQAMQLHEKDIELIQRALEVARDHGNTEPLLAVAEKIKSLLGIQTDLPPVKFLYIVIKDYNHLTSR